MYRPDWFVPTINIGVATRMGKPNGAKTDVLEGSRHTRQALRSPTFLMSVFLQQKHFDVLVVSFSQHLANELPIVWAIVTMSQEEAWKLKFPSCLALKNKLLLTNLVALQTLRWIWNIAFLQFVALLAQSLEVFVSNFLTTDGAQW